MTGLGLLDLGRARSSSAHRSRAGHPVLQPHESAMERETPQCSTTGHGTGSIRATLMIRAADQCGLAALGDIARRNDPPRLSGRIGSRACCFSRSPVRTQSGIGPVAIPSVPTRWTELPPLSQPVVAWSRVDTSIGVGSGHLRRGTQGHPPGPCQRHPGSSGDPLEDQGEHRPSEFAQALLECLRSHHRQRWGSADRPLLGPSRRPRRVVVMGRDQHGLDSCWTNARS